MSGGRYADLASVMSKPRSAAAALRRDRVQWLQSSDPILSVLKDPLSDASRKARRFLLVVSSVVLLAVLADLVPRELPALGIDIASAGEGWLYGAMLATNVYAFLLFGTYAIPDYMAAVHWRNRSLHLLEDDSRVRDYVLAWFDERIDEASDEHDLVRQTTELFREAMKVSVARLTMDFGVPAGLSFASMVLVATRFIEVVS